MKSTQGIGSISIDTKARNVVAQSICIFLYTKIVISNRYNTSERGGNLLCTVKRGNTELMPYRRRPFAAIALAPLRGPYVSTK